MLSSLRQRLSVLPRNVWAVTATSFLTDISSEMLFNLLPLFLANVLGVSKSTIGVIEGIAETTASLLKMISGWLSDKLNERKWLTVTGYTLSALSKPFLYGAGSWVGVLAVRFTDRVGKGIRTAPRDALIADSVDKEHRGIAFGIHRAGDTAGAMIGLIIALIVVLAHQSHAVELDRGTFQLLVLISVIPAVLAVLVLALAANDVPVKELEATSPEDEVKPNATLDRRFFWFLGIMVVFTMGNSADGFLILRAQDRGLTVAGILGMLITFNLIYALLSGPAGALSDKIGRTKLIVGGWFLYSMIYLGFALSEAAWHVWFLYAIYGLYYAVVEGTAKALVADLVPKEKRGTAYGYYNAAIGFTALPASVLAGVLWQTVDASAPFWAGAIFAIVAASSFLVWQRTFSNRHVVVA